jgi:CHAD domain-containing protein
MRPAIGDAAPRAEPAGLAVHRTALALLDDARDAAVVLVHATDDDPDALHDFRVAVRRLRSWLQLWKPLLGDTLSRRHRRDVRDIARATGPARDLQVHLEWLRGEHERRPGRASADVARLIERFEEQQRQTMADARDAAKELVEVHAEISRRLGEYCVEQRASSENEELLGAALAVQLRTAAAALRERLAAVHSSADHEATHAARIAAKRMRYLVEQIEDSTVGAAGIVRDLKALQDLAGDANDAYVFSGELKAAFEGGGLRGWRTLDRRLRARGTAAYGRLRRAWLGRASTTFFERADRLVHRLDPARVP